MNGSMGETAENVFLFVVWSAAREWAPQIEEAIGREFRIIRAFDVSWPKRHFARNLASFYGWKSWHIWRNKARKCGTGPFRVIVVEDSAPIWAHERDTFGHEMVVDVNVYRLKRAFRELTGRSNVVHSSVTREETEHQLAALAEPCDSPIPFRKMVYGDDARIRAMQLRVWMGLLWDIMVPILSSVSAGAVVWVDLFVLKTGCAEGGLVEWSGLLLSMACGALMTACAIKAKSGRGAHALFAAVFFDLAVREADNILDRIFGATIWPWALTVVTLTFAVVTVRYAKTVYSGLRAMRRSRYFLFFACGIALIIFISQLLGGAAVWQSLGVPDAARFSHSIEESIELFGYVLMFSWAASHSVRVLSGKRRTGRGMV